MLPGAEAGSAGETLGTGKDAHVHAHLGDEHFRRALVHAMDSVQPSKVIGERGHEDLDLADPKAGLLCSGGRGHDTHIVDVDPVAHEFGHRLQDALGARNSDPRPFVDELAAVGFCWRARR